MNHDTIQEKYAPASFPVGSISGPVHPMRGIDRGRTHGAIGVAGVVEPRRQRADEDDGVGAVPVLGRRAKVKRACPAHNEAPPCWLRGPRRGRLGVIGEVVEPVGVPSGVLGLHVPLFAVGFAVGFAVVSRWFRGWVCGWVQVDEEENKKTW